MSSGLLFVLGGVVGLLLGALGAVLYFGRERSRLASDAARLEAERDAALFAAEEQKRSAREGLDQLREAFSALASDALRHNREDFLHNAGALFGPVKETLARVQVHLTDVDKAREGSYRALTTQLGTIANAGEKLRTTTEQLSRALKSSTTRGTWGEVQLRRVLEAAGMLEQCDFVEKESVTTEDGARRTPDIVVKLPGGASIVIDAKVPMDAYLAAAETDSDAVRRDRLAAHTRQLREHIKALGAKDYWTQFQPAPEFVVMFLPLEPLLAAAFEQDASLFEYGAQLRVIPATPMTLLALLMAVASGWKQQHLAENAEEIRRVGRDLYERLATMFEHLDDVRRGIKQTADSYDRFLGSLEQKVEPAARRFKEMGVSATKDLEMPDPLALSVRQLAKPELRVVVSDKEEAV
jgi:DNA recombination protein RmuC